MPPEHSLVKILDFGESLDNITPLLLRGLQTTSPVPQDILYRASDGATLWCQLIRERYETTLGEVYRQFSEQAGACDKLVRIIADALRSRGVSAAPQSTKTGILVLGCGDGWREYKLCKALLANRIASTLRVVLVDISRDLVVEAARNFANLSPKECTVQPAVLDFQHVRHLRDIRNSQFKELGVIALLLGNTLGNVNERDVLAQLGDALSPGDILITEILLHNADSNSDIASDERSAEHDPRAHFIANPVRLLIGGNPEIANLRVKTRITPDRAVKTKTYSYHFSEEEARSVHYLPTGQEVRIRTGTRIALLEIKSMTKDYVREIMTGTFEDVVVLSQEYKVPKGTIELGYTFARRGQSSTPPRRFDGSKFIEIRSYNSLSIGIEASTSMYAFGKQFQDGDAVRKTEGHKFALKDKTQLYRLLLAFAESHDGQNISIVGAAQILCEDAIAAYRFSKNRNVGENPSDVGEDPAHVESRDARSPAGFTIYNKLNKKVADVARQLRNHLRHARVNCESPYKPPIFSICMTENRVTSAAQIRFLLTDSSGSYCFGRSMDR